MTRLRFALPSLLLVCLLAACSSPAASAPASPVPTASALAASPSAGTSPASSAALASGRVDLTRLDVCSLLTEQAVQGLTGSSVGFDSSGSRGKCFWGAKQAVPPYVEVEVISNPGGLAAYNFNPAGCTLAPLTGIGSEAKGAICPGAQTKVYLLAFDRGVILKVLVNAPERPVQPADIGSVANRVLQQITSG